MGDNYRFRDVTSGAGAINIGRGTQVGGDLTVSVGADLEMLSRALEELRLTATERQQAGHALHGAKGAAAAGDQAGVGGHMRRFTEVLKDAGALAGAGATLIDALTRIGRWLGPVGAAVLALL
jgi:hypothetical protein